MPEQVAQRVLRFYYNIRDNHLDETSTDLETLLERKPAPLTEGLCELFDRETPTTRTGSAG